jgi:ribosome modulation factor
MASEPQQSNVPNETILYYTHELTRSKRKIDEASSAHRLMVKRAKADGVPTVAILESIADARLEPEVRRQKIIDRIKVESARYPDSGSTITELVARMDTRVSEKMRHTDTLFDAEQRGYMAGKYGQSVDDCPYVAGGELAATWRQFWNEGQAANAAQLGENAKMANQRREREPRKTAAVVQLPLGDKPPRKQRKQPARKQQRRTSPNGSGPQPPAAA